MDNPEKLATHVIQDAENQTKTQLNIYFTSLYANKHSEKGKKT